MLHKSLLAMMIAIAPPGQSPYSVVPEPACGANPAKPACELTPAPSWSPLYKAFIRRENRAEAIERYIVIARSIEAAASIMTSPVRRDDGATEAPPWPWEERELAQALVAIAYHESGFRRDVHSGVGSSSLGDCGYWDQKGQRVSAERARTSSGVRYACRSVCLMQINTGGLEGARFGFTGKEMVGLDEASTQRCFAAGARAFTEARGRCAGARIVDWFAKSVASYGTGGSCETDEGWIKSRVNTFERIGKIDEAALTKDVRALFEIGTSPQAP